MTEPRIDDQAARIRPASVDDAPAIARAHVAGWHSTYKGILPDEFLARLSTNQREPVWQRILADPDPRRVTRIAEDEQGILVGFASGGPERSGNELYTSELYVIHVEPPHQRRSVGTRLMASVADGLLQAGMNSMLLWVVEANTACRFYDRLGGKRVDRKTELIGGANISEVAYAWSDLSAFCHALRL